MTHIKTPVQNADPSTAMTPLHSALTQYTTQDERDLLLFATDQAIMTLDEIAHDCHEDEDQYEREVAQGRIWSLCLLAVRMYGPNVIDRVRHLGLDAMLEHMPRD